jgi:hypothetical protein
LSFILISSVHLDPGLKIYLFVDVLSIIKFYVDSEIIMDVWADEYNPENEFDVSLVKKVNV